MYISIFLKTQLIHCKRQQIYGQDKSDIHVDKNTT